MQITRRDFIHYGLLWAGSSLLPGAPAMAAKDHDLYPSYRRFEDQGTLAERVKAAYAFWEQCELCPRRCGARRTEGETGFCQSGTKVKVYSAHPHFGEEKSLVGRNGSGTIFFSNCNLRCVFCQNWPIAHLGHGREIEDSELADLMLHLQQMGCHNINLVTPTHVMPNILKATQLACRQGLHIPLVYNTSGYERVEILLLLDGIVDIYLPDLKFMDTAQAATYLNGAADYPALAQAAIREMHRQVGEHQVDRRGVAKRGLMIRHLVMPNGVAGSQQFAQWVAEQLTPSTYVNIMAQYHPEFKAFDHPKIWRRISVQEYLNAMQGAQRHGLTNLDPDSIKMWQYYAKQLENEP